MARKKNPAATRKQEEIKPHAKPESPKQPHSPPSVAEDDMIGNLKTLNILLLKETMERREQVSHLSSLIDELAADNSFLSSLERDVSRLVVSSRLADERHRLEEEGARSLQATVDSSSEALRSAEARLELVKGEKDEIKNALDHTLFDRDESRLALDLKVKEAEDLEAMVQEMEMKLEDTERKMEEFVWSKKEEVESLVTGRTADASKITALEEERQSLALAKDRLEDELVGSRDVFLSLTGEKDEIKKALDRAVSDRDESRLALDLKAKEAEDLEAKVQEMEMEREGLERKMEEFVRSKKEEVESLVTGRTADASKITALEEERQSLAMAKDRLEDELVGSRDAFLSLKKEEETLRSEVVELDRRNAKVLEELERLRVDFGVLKKDKEETEKRFESHMKDSMEQLDDLGAKMGEMAARKDEIERARAEQDIEISGLQKEVRQLQSNVSVLERVCKDHAETNALLRADRDAAYSDLVLERGKAEDLRLQVAELEKSKDRFKEELKRIQMEFAQLKEEKEEVQMEFAQLKEEKEEGEKRFETQMIDSSEQQDHLSGLMGEIAVQKNELERAKANLELEIAGLLKQVEQFRSAVSALEGDCRDHAAANAQLQAERDAAQRDLDAEREEAGRLIVQIRELEKIKDGIIEELGQLKAERDSLIAEKGEAQGSLGSLMEEKALHERSLAAAQQELKDTQSKMRAAEMNSERALSLMRTTSKAMLGAGEGQENAMVREIAEMDEEMRPFATELETIKAALVSRAGKIEDLSREIGVLKNKRGFWAWLAPAMSTTALAAGLAVYAAKGR